MDFVDVNVISYLVRGSYFENVILIVSYFIVEFIFSYCKLYKFV